MYIYVCVSIERWTQSDICGCKIYLCSPVMWLALLIPFHSLSFSLFPSLTLSLSFFFLSLPLLLSILLVANNQQPTTICPWQIACRPVTTYTGHDVSIEDDDICCSASFSNTRAEETVKARRLWTGREMTPWLGLSVTQMMTQIQKVS